MVDVEPELLESLEALRDAAWEFKGRCRQALLLLVMSIKSFEYLRISSTTLSSSA